jgi:protein-S-isoprenylcysteine O-methyltransferase Ste14
MPSWVSFLQQGAPFQFVMIIAFIFRRASFYPEHYHLLVALCTLAGIAVFTYCLYVLYFRKTALSELVTTGPFRYTRHPMYTAFVFMDTGALFAPISTPLLISTAIFYGSLIAAAHFQEQETLTRFGAAAKEYYKKTPRIFLLYPLVNRR